MCRTLSEIVSPSLKRLWLKRRENGMDYNDYKLKILQLTILFYLSSLVVVVIQEWSVARTREIHTKTFKMLQSWRSMKQCSVTMMLIS